MNVRQIWIGKVAYVVVRKAGSDAESDDGLTYVDGPDPCNGDTDQLQEPGSLLLLIGAGLASLAGRLWKRLSRSSRQV